MAPGAVDNGRDEPRVDVASTGTGTAVDNDPAAGLLTGYPGARIRHSEAGGQGHADPAAGVVTGYPGDRTIEHVHPRTRGLDDPAAGVLTGYPGSRTTHSETGGQGVGDPAAGFLTGYPGDRTADHLEPTGRASGRLARAPRGATSRSGHE